MKLPVSVLLSILLGVCFHSASCAGSRGVLPAHAAVDLPFLTNRAIETDRNGEVRFGNDAGATTAGLCHLRVPESPEEAVVLDGYQAIERAALFRALDRRNETKVTLYVHGYNIGLRRACREAMLFARRTGLQGRLLLFSWPASRTIVTYHRDGVQFDASKPALGELLEELGRRYGRDRVNIVAHSMGARIVEAMVSELQAGEARFANLVLIAPDIDRRRFLALLPGLARRVRDITVLVSERDRLLLLSETVHLAERLGRSAGVVAEGVDTIDVTELDNAGFGGHLYHLTSASVGRAIGAILDGPAPPAP